MKIEIKGSTVYAYTWCERQAWFMHRGIIPEQDNTYLDLGRNVHTHTKKGHGHKELILDGMAVDRIETHNGKTYIYEVKNSLKNYKGVRLQMLFYLYRLRQQYGIEAIGILEFPRHKKVYTVKLTPDAEAELREFLSTLQRVLILPIPPKPKWSKKCEKCGYRNICFA